MIFSFQGPDRCESSSYCEHCGFSLIDQVIHCKVCHCIVHEDCRKYATRNFVGPANAQRSKKLGINNFNIVHELGRGSFGRVILAEWKDTNEPCAIKWLIKSSIIQRKSAKYVMTEKRVSILAAQHSFLTELYSCFQTPEHLYFVMEYVKGGSLAYHMKRECAFDEERTKFYAAEITIALQFLHRNGVIFRDLKLENVLLDQEGHCKLADFGLCKVIYENISKNETSLHTM